MKCEHCDIVEGRGNAEILYQDDTVLVAIKDMAVTPGQITVFPKQHFTILEMVPNDVLTKCAAIAKKVSIAAFESLGSKGTNVIVKNGLGAGQTIPHFSIDVIPRQENDGLQLEWKPTQLMEDEMESTLAVLEKDAKKITLEEKKETKKPEQGGKEEKVEEEKENYLLKSIRRIP